MPGFNWYHDLGEYIAYYPVASVYVQATAVPSEASSTWIDRNTDITEFYTSAVLLVSGEQSNSTGVTCSVAANLQDATSSTGAGAADHGTATATSSTSSTSAPNHLTLEVDLDLTEANEFIRVQHTPTMSTDAAGPTLIYSVGLILSGGNLPAS